MKSMRLFSSPYLLIFSFLFVLISGEHLGGFYLLYLLLALPHGGVHSLLAIAGVFLLVFTHQKMQWPASPRFRLLGFLLGAALLVASLISFFINDKKGYNYQTFEQVVPMTTIILFGILAILFITLNCFLFLRHTKDGKSAMPVNGQ